MFLLFLLYNFICQSSPGDPAVYAPIRINITHISSNKGEILIALYSTDKGFPGGKEGATRTVKANAQKGNLVIAIDDVAPGTYAIALFHDTNNDGKLNFNFLGIPKEGYGFSNNASNLFSAPKFKQAAFIHKEMVTQLDIRMKY